MAKTRNSGAPQYKSFGLVLQALVILAKKEVPVPAAKSPDCCRLKPHC